MKFSYGSHLRHVIFLLLRPERESHPRNSGFAIRRVSTSPSGRLEQWYHTFMITDSDITKLKKAFATKDALADLSLEVGELHDKFDKMDNTLHFIVGELADMREDNAAWLSLFNRHSHQIEYVATYVGITDLPLD